MKRLFRKRNPAQKFGRQLEVPSYSMESHKKTGNIRGEKKGTTIPEGIFLWTVCFWVCMLMAFLGKPNLNSGSVFPQFFETWESQRAMARLKKKSEGKADAPFPLPIPHILSLYINREVRQLSGIHILTKNGSINEFLKKVMNKFTYGRSCTFLVYFSCIMI